MKNIINLCLALIISAFFIFGSGYGLKKIHDFVRDEALKTVSGGLSSSEDMANALTGEAGL